MKKKHNKSQLYFYILLTLIFDLICFAYAFGQDKYVQNSITELSVEKNNDSITFQELGEIINITPAWMRENITAIYLSDKCPTINHTKRCDSDGFYDIKYKVIALRNKDRFETLFNLYHELGHHVWYTKMNETQRNNWESYKDKGITRYAENSTKEDFAENFAVFYATTHHNLVVNSPQKGNGTTWVNISENKLRMLMEIDNFQEIIYWKSNSPQEHLQSTQKPY